jgi:hypothetical protein
MTSGSVTSPATSASKTSSSGPRRRVDYRGLTKAVVLGALSGVMYASLYSYSPELTSMALATHAGDKTMFFVPIVIALVFSLVHGSFTSQFWDVLGVKPNKNTKK